MFPAHVRNTLLQAHEEQNVSKEGAIDAKADNAGSNGANYLALRDVTIALDQDWQGSLGAILPAGTEMRLRFVGRKGAPLIGVFGGISATRVIIDDGKERGWWTPMAGPGAPIDLDRFEMVSMDFAAGDGKTPLSMSSADHADLLSRALKGALVSKLHALVGASFGGMMALSFARQFPGMVDRLIILCAAHRPSPLAQAWRTVQRKILAFGLDADRPQEAVAIARGLAMTTYRSGAEFNARFSCAEGANGGVESYLTARGKAYGGEMPAARYLTLSASIDNHFERPEDIKTPSLLIAIDSDQIVPLDDMRDLENRLAGPTRIEVIPSLYGHDGFLKEYDVIGPLVSAYLDAQISKE